LIDGPLEVSIYRLTEGRNTTIRQISLYES